MARMVIFINVGVESEVDTSRSKLVGETAFIDKNYVTRAQKLVLKKGK